MDSSTIEIVGIGVTVGLAGASCIGALLKWSLDRNAKAMDKKIDELTGEVSKFREEITAIRDKAVTDAKCSSCRTECRSGFTAWMARLETKFDNQMMMLANLNNGIGGVRS